MPLLSNVNFQYLMTEWSYLQSGVGKLGLLNNYKNYQRSKWILICRVCWNYRCEVFSTERMQMWRMRLKAHRNRVARCWKLLVALKWTKPKIRRPVLWLIATSGNLAVETSAIRNRSSKDDSTRTLGPFRFLIILKNLLVGFWSVRLMVYSACACESLHSLKIFCKTFFNKWVDGHFLSYKLFRIINSFGSYKQLKLEKS